MIQPIQILIVRLNVSHCYGPKKVEFDVDELIVLCLVKNGELYIKSFIEHYFSLGAKHIVLLDNNSTDNTLTIAQNYPSVTALQTKLSFKYFKLAMRLYLIRRFGKGRWSLIVDIDELFDYPYSDVITLRSLLTYLNSKSFTAVVAHMLDMFSDKPLSSITSTKYDSLKELYRYYDISPIIKMDYYYRRNLVGDKIKLLFGGITTAVFGTDYEPGIILSKHPLVFLDNKLIPLYLNEHGVRNATIADFTCVLFHYKFLGNFYEYAVSAAKEGNYHKNSIVYKRYAKALRQNPNLQIIQKTSQKLNNANELIDNHFLVVSDDYLSWVQQNAAK
jgi:glycosyltransferase involved in cell wall biosynthesis